MRNYADIQPSLELSARRAARSGRRAGAAVAVTALLIASCGGDDDASPATTPTVDAEPASSTQPAPSTTGPDAPTTVTSPTTEPDTTEPEPETPTTDPAGGSVLITSADGNLTLEVGAADAERVDPSIRILDPSEWPAELGDADQLPGVTIYEMEPDGAVFDEPVTVTRRLDVASFGDEVGAFDVPLVVPFTQEDDGRFVPLDDLDVTRIGSSLYASGTTRHFTPLGTIDLGMDLRFPGVPHDAGPIISDIDPADYRDLAASYEFEDLALMEGVRDLNELIAEVVPRRSGPPPGFPGLEPVEVQKVERKIPTQTSEQDATELYRLLSGSDSVPSSPIFEVDGVEVLKELQVAVGQYIMSTNPAEQDRLEEIADQIAAGACLSWEVIHTPFGGFPSYSRSTLTKVPELGDGEQLFAALYTGDFGPDAQLVDIAEMLRDGDGYTADVGLASYGDVRQTLIVTTEDAAPGPEMTDREFFDSVMSLPGDAVMLFLDDPFTVDASEGVIFDGDVRFQVYPGP